MITAVNTKQRLFRRRHGQRGIALIWMVASSVVVMISAGFAIDMGFLYFQRQNLQAAADAAALAGDWALAQSFTDTNAETVATKILTMNGLTAANGATITLTPHSAGVTNNFTVTVTKSEPMYFARVIGNNDHTLSGSATANFVSYNTMWFSPSYYGWALETPFALVSYGPDQGDTRGDAVNTRWNDVTGEYPKTPNPLNYNPNTGGFYDAGENFIIQPLTNWASVDPIYSTTDRKSVV